MKDIRKIHLDAMQLVRQAERAEIGGEQQVSLRLVEEAYLLEREAANELLAHPESEPTRGVLLRSAATLALQLGRIEEAESLVESGLSGNPFPEIISDLLDLQKKILQSKSGEGHSPVVYNIKEDQKEGLFVSEPDSDYIVVRPQDQNEFDFADLEALYKSFSTVDKDGKKHMYPDFAHESFIIIRVMVSDRSAANNVFRNTIKDYQSYFRQFDVQSIFQARTLLYLVAHHHSTQYCSEQHLEINAHTDILSKAWKRDRGAISVRKYFDAYKRLSPKATTILSLLLDGREAGEIGREIGTAEGSVEDVKKEIINLLPDENQ